MTAKKKPGDKKKPGKPLDLDYVVRLYLKRDIRKAEEVMCPNCGNGSLGRKRNCRLCEGAGWILAIRLMRVKNARKKYARYSRETKSRY